MELNIEQVVFLLLIAALIAVATHRLRIPYTVGLMLVAVALALFPLTLDINFAKDLIFTIFLPPLIYQTALYIRWKELHRDLPVILFFAVMGVLLSAAVTTIGMRYLANWQWQSAILFGLLIAAIDPVSVIASFKEARVYGRLRLLVGAESLFNNSVAVAAFGIVLAFAMSEPVTAVSTIQTLTITVVGGILCGVLVAGSALLLAGRTVDHLVVITMTIIAAYGSFLLADYFHLSGILAALTAGLLTGNIGPLGSISAKRRDAVVSFWEYIVLTINSLIFILIGIREANENFLALLIPIGVAIILVIVGRALTVYPLSALFSRSSLQLTAGYQHILFWGGLRGALALALALGLPAGIPQREEIVTVTFGVVIFSLFIQGLTMAPLLNKLKETPAADTGAHPKIPFE